MNSARPDFDASSDPLPLMYRVIFGFGVAVFALVILSLPAAVLLAWIVHFRRLPDWLVNGLGATVAIGVLFSSWLLNNFVARRRYRFSLRLAMICTAALALGLSILAHELRLVRREHSAVQALWEDGSYAQNDLKPYEDSAWFLWLILRFGHDPFAKVSEVYVKTDRGVDALLAHHADFAGIECVRFGSGVTDKGLQRVAEFNHFFKLKLAEFGASLTDAGLKQLKQWKNLPMLSLNGCNKITDNGLSHLFEMPALKHLSFISEGTRITPITDAGLGHVGKIRHLRILYILGLPITDAGLDHLKGLEDLQVMYINRTQITRRGVERLQRELPQSQILSDAK